MTIQPQTERDVWLAARLAARGETIARMETVRNGPGGDVVRVESSQSVYYLKTCVNSTAHEPGLVTALAEWFPQDIPAVLAADPARGWLLMADAGPTLRELVRAGDDTSRLVTLARRFATLQRASAARAGALLALGVPDRRLERLPEQYEALLADQAALRVGQEDGLSEDDEARLRAFGPALRDLCERLSRYTLPYTIQHDDLHSGNAGVRDGEIRVFDWGESFIGPPLTSLLIALRDAKWILDVDGATLDAMREAYLSAWADLEPMGRLRDAAEISFRLAALGRALSWWRVLACAGEVYRAENADAVPYWLLTFLNDTPLE